VAEPAAPCGASLVEGAQVAVEDIRHGVLAAVGNAGLPCFGQEPGAGRFAEGQERVVALPLPEEPVVRQDHFVGHDRMGSPGQTGGAAPSSDRARPASAKRSPDAASALDVPLFMVAEPRCRAPARRHGQSASAGR